MAKDNGKKEPSFSELLINNVASVSVFKPKFNPQSGKIFSDELKVLGTAFWAGKEKVLVTCAHVVESMNASSIEQAGLLVIGYKGKFYRSSIGIVDNQHDLATLDVMDEINAKDADLIVGLSISSAYSEAGSKVSWAGYPLGNALLNEVHEPTYNEGVVGMKKRTEKFRKNVQISGTVIGGYSGSPIIDQKTQKILGVVSNGPQNSGIFMGISYEHVEALVNLKVS